MLGKLLKNEWKATWKLPLAICAFVCVMTFVGSFSFRMPIWQRLAEDNVSAFSVFDFSAVMFLLFYFLTVIASAYAVMIYFAVRFYKNLYTDEGYLMHTLPVTPRQLILSKCLVSVLWNLLSSALILGCIFFLMFVLLRTLLSDLEWDYFRQTLELYLPRIDEAFRAQTGISLAFYPVVLVLFAVIGNFSGMLTIYASISVGQLFRRHKVAASILSYLVITSIIQTLTTLIILPFTFGMVMKMSRFQPASPIDAFIAPYAYTMPTYLASMVLSLISIIGFYFLTEYIMKRKLNLD